MNYLPLLQSTFYQTSTNWRTAAVFVGVVVILGLAGIIYSKMNSGKIRGRSGKRFSRRAFRREASSIGLNRYQIRIMEKCIRAYDVRNPFNLLSNTRESAVVLSKALRDLNSVSMEAAEREEQKLEIYRIRQILDQIFADTNRINNTRQLRLGQNVTFQLENGNRFPSVISANLKDFYCAEVPRNKGGELVKWRKGSKIILFIWGLDNQEIMFESRVINYTEIKGINSVILTHTNKMGRASQRRHRRRPLNIRCTFYPVRITGNLDGKRRKNPRKAVVMSNRENSGNMTSISAGGCAISCFNAPSRGELIKINFDLPSGDSVVLFGRIMDVRTLSRSKVTIHVMFTRSSNANLNKINRFVYDTE